MVAATTSATVATIRHAMSVNSVNLSLQFVKSTPQEIRTVLTSVVHLCQALTLLDLSSLRLILALIVRAHGDAVLSTPPATASEASSTLAAETRSP
jgi:hypothetical protein